MTDQTNNWDRQLDKVTLRIANLERRKLQLGDRAELRKEEFRAVFPVVQRLQWSKWSPAEIFLHAMFRAMPSRFIYLNVAAPSKMHRFLLEALQMSAALMACCIMLLGDAGVEEAREAMDKPVWYLLSEIFSLPWQGQTLAVVVLADLLGRITRLACAGLFFSCKLPSEVPGNANLRREQLKYWHDLAETGKWICITGTTILVAGTVALCSLQPQVRAAAVARTYLIDQLWFHLLFPILSAGSCTVVLCTTRVSGYCDGLLSVFPAIMDFEFVGVQTPEFLTWRVQRIISEEEMLLQVHRGGRNVKYDVQQAW